MPNPQKTCSTTIKKQKREIRFKHDLDKRSSAKREKARMRDYHSGQSIEFSGRRLRVEHLDFDEDLDAMNQQREYHRRRQRWQGSEVLHM